MRLPEIMKFILLRSDEMAFYMVLKKFEEYYKKAMKNPFIRKPIAWSLYQTWKWVDANEGESDSE